jgi:hypothetical protein
MSRTEVLTETMPTLFRTEVVKKLEHISSATEVLKENVTVLFELMVERASVTHFVLHIRYEGKSYEGERNALFCRIQVKKGKLRRFVSNRSYKENSNTFCFEEQL